MLKTGPNNIYLSLDYLSYLVKFNINISLGERTKERRNDKKYHTQIHKMRLYYTSLSNRIRFIQVHEMHQIQGCIIF